MDVLLEQLSRNVANRTSRRGFLARLAEALIGGAVVPLLPFNRVVYLVAAGTDSDELNSCDYWRYCGFDGYLCNCCGGSISECPAGTAPSPTSWVGTCHNPADDKEYIIAYRDCCGKSNCGRCVCDNNKGQMPVYRPQVDNDIVWCFGANNFAYHCTTAISLGVKS
jgi:methylamine dehydrogenase light chain